MKRTFPIHLAALLVTIMSIPCLAFPGARNRLTVSNLASLDAPKPFALAAASAGRLIALAEPVRMAGHAPGVGRFSGNLTQQRPFGSENGAQQLLLRGTVNIGGERRPVALSVISYPTQRTLTMLFDTPSSRKKGRRRLIQLRASIPKVIPSLLQPDVRVKRIAPDVIALPCGVSDEPSDATMPSAAAAFASEAGAMRYATIATDGDGEFAAKYGTGAKARITAMIDAAEIIYTRDAGIGFDIGTQRIGTTYSGSDVDELLPEFQNRYNATNALGAADVYHLFSAKPLTGTAIGLAYKGVVCREGDSFSYGVSQEYTDDIAVHMITFAHEVGHNFNASHTTGIMAAIIDPGATGFSDASIAEMTSYVSRSGACLQSSPATPTRVPTSVPTAAPTSAPNSTPVPTKVPTSVPPKGPPGAGPTPPAYVPYTSDLKPLKMSLKRLSGKLVLVKTSVINAGYGYAAPSSYSFYLGSKSKPSSSDRKLGSASMSMLAPGQISPASGRVTLPRSARTGRYYITVTVDSNKDVEESAETNNWISKRVPNR